MAVDIVTLVKEISSDFKKVLHRSVLNSYPQLNWGNNGVGDRWANKKFNYTVVYSTKRIKLYSENDDDSISEDVLNEFFKEMTGSGIVGIFVHSLRENKETDFQALCNACNLKKRQVSKDERKDKKLHSAKSMPQYAIYPFPFPWELKAFDEKDINTKKDTYWYDPIEFNKKIYNRIRFLQEIKSTVKKILVTR